MDETGPGVSSGYHQCDTQCHTQGSHTMRPPAPMTGSFQKGDMLPCTLEAGTCLRQRAAESATVG